jgi:hypothetical protein
MNQERGTCKLCRCDAVLQRSHVIPRFVMSWLRQTGARRFYRALNPKLPIQDSPKRYLLCAKCEQRFAPWERWFAETILRRGEPDWHLDLEYGPDLYRFAVSVLWRISEIGADKWKAEWPQHWEQISARQEQWRTFLLGDSFATIPVHMFVVKHGTMAVPRQVSGFNEYMLRFSDGTLAGGQRRCYAFAKFAHFVLFAPMAGTGFDEAVFENTLICPDGGNLTWDQWIGDLDFTGMLLGRVEILNKARESVGLPRIER